MAAHVTIQLSSKEDKLPTFLFEGYLWDKNDALSGFGLGEYFLRCYRHIFTSPSSAIKGENKLSRACNSKITGISEATPEGVAYVAVQAHFAATSWSSWNKILKYGKFSYVEFYDTVVRLFSVDPDGEWQQATLKAITNKVFEKIDDSGRESDDSSPGFSALIAARNKQARDRPSKLSSSSSEPEDLPRTSSPEGSQSSIVSAPEPPPRARPANATVSKNKPGRDDTDADEHREESPSAGRTHFPTPAAADGDARSTSSSPAPRSLPRRKPKQSMPLDDDEAEDIEAEGSLLVTSPPNAPSLTKPASTSEKVQRLGASKKKHGTGLPVEPTWLSPWSSDEEGNASKDGPDTGDLSLIVNKSLDTTDHPKLPAQKKRKVKHLAQPAASGSRSTRLTRANAGAPG
ncbi:hypothetical protein OF83DRAFT_1179592 [Amylostereum chailletii]|nr:hypothetical protein OF83DRAFT_1179592 [Amylostereum chailletii]